MNGPMKNIDKAQVLVLRDQVAYQDGQIVSKTLAQNSNVSITLFSFDKGEEISSHKAGGDAFVTCLDGEGEITINGDTGCDITIACDTVIEACELAANTTLADAPGSEMTVVTVGDALVDPAKPHNIAEAIATGNLAARAI